MDLFQHSAKRQQKNQPLAERLRPQTLSEVIGQDHLLAEGKWLAGFGESDILPSFILWGPPGTGKTTLARLLAQSSGASFDQLSAVSCGIKEVRDVFARAETRQNHYGERSILFLDEIHRFSKSQQDALLPQVEAGVMTLIGATTENPSFHVNSALLSRVRVLTVQAHTDKGLGEIVERALRSESGLSHLNLCIDEDAKSALFAAAAGDARRALGVLENAASMAARRQASRIAIGDIREASQSQTLLYDKSGDQHYAIISAFIKSMRASDADASVYWMMRMLEAGEDPLFLLRRLIVFASEDIGNADPQALILATAALAAYQMVGLPEGSLAITQATAYLAKAPKSNAAIVARANARALVAEHGALPVPENLQPTGTHEPSVAKVASVKNGADSSCLPQKIVGQKIVPET